MRKSAPLYPATVPPESWDMDDIFTRLLRRQERLWARKGYKWEWALELEFTPQLRSEYEFFLKQEAISLRDDMPLHREIANAHHSYKNLKDGNIEPNVERARETIETLIAYYRDENNREALEAYLSHKKIGVTIDEALEELEEFRQCLDDSAREIARLELIPERELADNGALIEQQEIQRLAISDIMLAELHTFKQDKGGIADLIEPRFGSRRLGDGWWDGVGTAEIRIPPQQEPREFVDIYHKLVARLTSAMTDYGLVANFGGVQLNFNLRRLSDGKNMMLVEDDADIDFHKRMLAGIYRLFDEAPHLKNDLRSTDGGREDFEISAFNTKSAFIHLRPERFEIRKCGNNGYMHLSREMAFYMTGAAYGMFNIQNIDAYIERNGTPLEEKIVPVTYHRHDLRNSNLEQLISTANIGDDGWLEPHPAALTAPKRGLVFEIGLQNASTHEAPLSIGGDFYMGAGTLDLHHSASWSRLARSLRLREDNTLDTGHLHAELREAFDNIVITGRRRIVTGDRYTLLHGPATLQTTLCQLQTSPILKAYLPRADLLGLHDGYRDMIDAQLERHALELSRKLQDHLTQTRAQNAMLNDFLVNMEGLLNVAEANRELPSEITHDSLPYIESFARTNILIPDTSEYGARLDYYGRGPLKPDPEMEPLTLRQMMIEQPARLKTYSATIAKDLRQSAEKMRRDNPGSNTLPALCEDFTRAAAYLEEDLQDPRLQAGAQAQDMIERLQRKAKDGELGAADVAATIMHLSRSLSDQCAGSVGNAKFSTDECVSIFRESYTIAADAFKGHVKVAIGDPDKNRALTLAYVHIARHLKRMAGIHEEFRANIT